MLVNLHFIIACPLGRDFSQNQAMSAGEDYKAHFKYQLDHLVC